MRIVIPQKQIESLARQQALNQEITQTTRESSSNTNSAESLAKALQDAWRTGDREAFITELERLSDLNLWKQAKVDLVMQHELFNIIDELLESLLKERDNDGSLLSSSKEEPEEVEMIDTSAKQEPSSNPKVETSSQDTKFDSYSQKIVKFLKVSLIYSTNTHYFNSTELIVKLYQHYQSKHNMTMLEEILGLLITLGARQNEKKGYYSQTPSSAKAGLDKFNDQIADPVMTGLIGLIRSFDFIIDLLLISSQSSQDSTATLNFKQLFDQKIQSLIRQSIRETNALDDTPEDKILQDEDATVERIKDQVMELRRLETHIKDRQSIEDVVLILFRAINLYLNVGNMKHERNKISQSTQLEQLLPPKNLIKKFIQIINTPTLSKRVHIQSMNIFFLFIILDMNQLFSYSSPTDNQYYQQACLYHDTYISQVKFFSKYHAYYRLKELKQGLPQTREEVSSIDQPMTIDTTSQAKEDANRNIAMTQSEFQAFLDQQKDLVGIENEEDYTEGSDSIKSQRYFNSFLNLLVHLTSFKNRQLQTQLYPQFMKPLLAICYAKPVKDNVYPINITVQLKAAKLLKEVAKMSSFEEPQAVERIIERLKDELFNLYWNDTIKWEKLPDDDCESEIHQLYRQDLIRTYLRLLCYSIIRNDPNAINFTQNFVANSRKILESGLLQVDMIKYIFEPNRSKSEAFLTSNIDPVILQCLQLIQYLFNDLPQKIPQYLDNQLFQQILASLIQRIPIHPDVISLLLKFIQTICLNKDGASMIAQSQIFKSFASIACDPLAHKFIINQNKAMIYSEAFQQVAGQSKEIALNFLRAVFRSFETLIDNQWVVVQEYTNMERELDQLGEQGSKEDKDKIRIRYEKKQINLEMGFEACASFLFYLIESDSAMSMVPQVAEAIKDLHQAGELDILEKIITTPIVASACSSMFPAFIESLLQILFSLGLDYKTSYITKIFGFIETQLKNLEELLKTKDFDSISDVELAVEKVIDLKFCETQITKEHQELMNELKAQDQASVVFGKIAFYSEIIHKCRQEVRSRIFKLDNFQPVMWKLFKVQALINRYHATKYEKDIQKEMKKLDELKQKYQQALEATDFTKFTPIKEPLDEEDEVRNLYFKYEADRVPSLTDQKARESFKTAIELQLDENISHTSNMCQQAVRKLIITFLRQMNRNKNFHFYQGADSAHLEFNKMIGDLIAEEFLDFKKIYQNQSSLETDQDWYPSNETEVMKYCCQFSAIFSEFNKMLFGSYSFGVMLMQFIQRGGLNCVKEIIIWLIRYIYYLEKEPGLKSLNQCKNIQLLWSHLIDFFVQLFEGKYLDLQYQQFLIAFKENPTVKLEIGVNGVNEESQKAELERANKLMKTYFIDIMAQAVTFLFVDLNQCKWVSEFRRQDSNGDNINTERISVFQYFDQISELFLVSMVDIYSFICKGLTHVKIFKPEANQAPKTVNSRQNQNIVESSIQQNLAILVEMGFDQNRARRALEITNNDQQRASELLVDDDPILRELPVIQEEPSSIHNEDLIQLPESFDKTVEKAKTMSQQALLKSFTFDIEFGNLSKKDIIKAIAFSFKDYIRFVPQTSGKLAKKVDIIENIFFKIGTSTDSDIIGEVDSLLQEVRNAVFTLTTEAQLNRDIDNLGVLAQGLTNLLTYRKGSVENLIVNEEEVYKAIFEVIELFTIAVAKLKDSLSYQPMNLEEAKLTEEVKALNKKKKVKIIIEQMRNLESCIQLFMYITEEGKASSDLQKLKAIFDQCLNKTTLSETEKQFEALYQKNIMASTFKLQSEQTGLIYQKLTLCMIDLFKSLHFIEPELVMDSQTYLLELILRSLEVMNFLMNTKSYSNFDCQRCFKENEGLRALFGIRTYTKESLYPIQQQLDAKKVTDIQIQSKVLVQVLCQNDQSQIKVYENLIKSVLFIYFQERYKKEEGVDIKQEFVNYHALQQQDPLKQSQTTPKGQQQKSKKKHVSSRPTPSVQSPNKQFMKSNSESLGKEILGDISSKALKAIKFNLLKKSDLGDAPLDDFIQFFNNIMKVQDFKSFLIACQNVCTLKKKKVPKNQLEKIPKLSTTVQGSKKEEEEKKHDQPQQNQSQSRNARAQARRDKKSKQDAASKEEEKKDPQVNKQEEEVEIYCISLSVESFKDMVVQYEQNMNLASTCNQASAENEKLLKCQIQQIQQEIMIKMLDQFIDQLRDQQMLIIQHCQQKQNQGQLGLESRIDNNGHLIFKRANNQFGQGLSHQNYLFDYVTIISHLTYMITNSPILVRVLLKHREGKTFKYIIRNLYYLMTLTIDYEESKQTNNNNNLEQEYRVWFDHTVFFLNRPRVEVINEFFKRVMLDNPHLTTLERSAKLDARIVFQKEILRNLTFHIGSNTATDQQSKFPLWPQLKIVFNLGALWLLSIVLKQEQPEDIVKTEKQLEDLIVNMQKY